MENLADMEIEDAVEALGEIGVGAAILVLRQINIARRRLVTEYPEAAPAINAALEQIERLAEPASEAIGELVSALAGALEGEKAERVRETGNLVAAMGPELLRLSGLTRRD